MNLRKTFLTLLLSLLILIELPVSTFAKEVNPYKKMQRGLRVSNLLVRMDSFETYCAAEYSSCPWDVGGMLDSLSDAVSGLEDAKDALGDDVGSSQLRQEVQKARKDLMSLAREQLPQFKNILKAAERDWEKVAIQVPVQPQPQSQPQAQQPQQQQLQSQQPEPQPNPQNSSQQQQPVNTPPPKSNPPDNTPFCSADKPELSGCKCPPFDSGTLSFASANDARIGVYIGSVKAQNLLIGTSGAVVAGFVVSASQFSCAREDVDITRIKLTDTMTGANALDGFRNIGIYDQKNKLITTTLVAFQKVNGSTSVGEFTLQNPLRVGANDGYGTWFTVRADVNGADGSTHVISIASLGSDVSAIGVTSQKIIVPRGKAIGNIQTIISSGTLTVSKGPGDEGTLRIGDSAAYLASFSLSADGENVHVTSLTFTDMMSGQNAIDSIRNIRLYFFSTQLGETLPKLTSVNGTTATGTFSFNFHVGNGAQPHQLIIKADIVSGEGSTHQVKINAPEADIVATGDITKKPIKASGPAVFTVQTIGPKLRTPFDP